MIPDETIAALRDELPGIDDNLYLNHGTSGRSPVGVGQRIDERQQRWQRIGPGSLTAAEENWSALESARAAIAELVGAAREAVALTASTSLGLAIVFAGLSWQPGDELLISDREHPGLLVPAAVAAARWKLSIRTFPADAPNPVTAVRGALTPRTRLAAFSQVLYTSGRLLPVEAIAAACHGQGTLVLVDGAQSAGVVPVRPLESGIDFYAATCHKWLSGPEGTGFLIVAPEHLARGTVHPTVVGYAAGGPNGEIRSTAARYEGSTTNFADFSAVPIAMDFLRCGGTETARHARIVQVARHFRDCLRRVPGARLLLEPDEAQQSGLVSWSMDSLDPLQVASRLAEEHQIIIRTVPSPSALRASFHFYNTLEEAERLAERLTTWRGEGVKG